MKLAVISDVHGNLPALSAVLEDVEQWRPDALVVNGDLINRGPDSIGVLRYLQQQVPTAAVVQGNHEAFVLREATLPDDPSAADFALRRFARWSAEQLKAADALPQVADWPDHLELVDPDGGRVHVTHGSVLGNRAGILPNCADEELRAKLGDPRDLFIAAHTHRPLIRNFEGTLVANVGSVGAPFDRDPRAAYGRFTYHHQQWRAAIRRVPFDRAAAARSFESSGFLDGAGPLARLMLTELHDCRGHMGPWMRHYQQPVLAGAISVEAAVDNYLASL